MTPEEDGSSMDVRGDTSQIILFGEGLRYDPYYLRVIADDARTDVATVLEGLLHQWANALAEAEDGGTLYLPYSLDDEWTECLEARVDGEAVVTRCVHVGVSGYALDPLHLGEFIRGDHPIHGSASEEFATFDRRVLTAALKAATVRLDITPAPAVMETEPACLSRRAVVPVTDWHTDQTWRRWVEEHERRSPRVPQNVDAIAEIKFLTPEEGGRSNPVQSGYRGQFHYDGGDWDAVYTFGTDDWVQPGETVEAILQFLRPEAHQGRIHGGMEFEVREGSRVIGEGRLSWVDAAF